jgi:hypothetical protein
MMWNEAQPGCSCPCSDRQKSEKLQFFCISGVTCNNGKIAQKISASGLMTLHLQKLAE